MGIAMSNELKKPLAERIMLSSFERVDNEILPPAKGSPAMRKKVERFEDLIAWQKARELTKDVYLLCRSNNLSKDLSLKDQLQRSAVSTMSNTMSNIAEGFERGSASDFHRFLTIAKASSAELRSQLYIAMDVGYISQETFNQVMKLAQEVSNIIGGLRTAVAKRKTN